MYRIIPRGEVGLQAPRKSLTPFSYVDGIIVHYVGSSSPMSLNPTVEQSKAVCRSIQQDAFNNASEGYSDIQYNHLIDPNGNIFEGRGYTYKSGANGSSNYNGHALSVCVLIGVNQPMTQACRDALIWYEHDAVARYSMISYVKPHSEVAPQGTFCPGDSGRAFVPEMAARLHETAPPPSQPAPPEDDLVAKTIISPFPATVKGRVAFAELIPRERKVKLWNGARTEDDHNMGSYHEWRFKSNASPTGIAMAAKLDSDGHTQADPSAFVVTAADGATFKAIWKRAG